MNGRASAAGWRTRVGEQRHGDDRDDVGSDRQERRVDGVEAEARNRQSEGRDDTEQDAAGDGALQRPAAEDHGGDGDVSAAADQRVLEPTGAGEQEEAAGEAGGQPRQVDRLAPQLVDVQARHVGSVRVLADGAHLEAPARAVDHEPDDGDDPVREVQHPRARRTAPARGAGSSTAAGSRSGRRRWSSARSLTRGTRRDRVSSTLSTSPTTNWSAGRRWLMLACTSATSTPANMPHSERDPHRAGGVLAHGGGERAGEHHRFERDVDGARLLGDELARGGEQQHDGGDRGVAIARSRWWRSREPR